MAADLRLKTHLKTYKTVFKTVLLTRQDEETGLNLLCMKRILFCSLLLLFLLFDHGGKVEVQAAATDLYGGIITDIRTLSLNKSPYRVTGNLVIEKEGEMRIEPGVELQFVAGVGLTVRGILKADGRENSVIRFTRFTTKPNEVLRAPTDIRLVDGPSINEGRLQLFYRGKWRSVCTNSRNWTVSDFSVACRQMGFLGGSFSRWFPRNNDSSQLLYERPGCSPNVGSLMSCNWASKQLGSGVCDLHYDIGIHCEPLSLKPLEHWRGLRFEDPLYFFDTILQRSMSRSNLRHVEILYAGWNATSNFTSALETYGVPPDIDRTTVKWSAYTGINVTQPQAEFDITNCLVSDNRGYGVFINSSTGLARVLDSTILGNGADGIRYVVHYSLQPLFRGDSVEFCGYTEKGSYQLYPLLLNAVQEKSNSPNAQGCSKVFYVDRSRAQVLTLSFAYLESTAENGGEFEVRDGSFESSPLLMKFTIRNGTRPQSVTTTGNALFVRFAPSPKNYVVASLEIVSHRDKAYDLNVTGTTVKGNNGRGIAMENLRSMLHVVSSQVTQNKYLAGIHVSDGAGDVNITRTEISENFGDGVNISYAGGRRNLTSCNVMRNEGRGVAIWLNESSVSVPADQYTVVAYSTFLGNRDIGLLVGNFCRPSVLNVTYVAFQTSEQTALKIDACWRPPQTIAAPPPLTVYVTHSTFIRQQRPAVLVSPATNMKAFISYNRFFENGEGALLIRNPQDIEMEFEILPTEIDIKENTFENNTGPYVVAIGLSQYSLIQHLRFERNELLRNRVTEPFTGLNPRRRVASVVAISSSNVHLYRNIFQNPNSRYELGSHLSDHYATINATYCYFGKYGDTDALKVYDRVFDSKDRYDLASIGVTPYLMVPYKEETQLISLDQSNQLVVDFQTDDKPMRLGGTVYGRQELSEGTYTVWRDIYVRSQSELVLTRKTTLKFAPSVGMMVQGRLTVRGEKNDHAQQVVFTLSDDVQPVAADPPVRLVGGSSVGDMLDGVLQVRIGDHWGTICNYGWNRHSAAVACATMGLVLNPSDWHLERGQLPDIEGQSASDQLPILLSNVKCTEFDVDLLKCRAENADNFEGSCSQHDVVRLRCYRQTWAGVRLGLMADPSEIRAAQLERAGVLDATTGEFRPALQLDLNRHRLEDVTVSRNLDSGIGVLFNDFYSDVDTRRIAGCVLEGNLGSGIQTRTSGLRIDACLMRSNRGHGFFYDPSLEHSEQRELSLWLDRSKPHVVTLTPFSAAAASISSSSLKSRHLNRGQGLYLVLDSRTPSRSARENGAEMTPLISYRIATDFDNVFGIQLLAPLHNGTTDQARIYDGPRSVLNSPTWDVRNDELDFPSITAQNEMIIEYERPERHSHGDAVIYVTAVEKRPVFPPPGPVPTIRMTNSDVRQNQGAGFSVIHHNHQMGPLEQRRLRLRNESLEVFGCRFVDNKRAAILIDSPFHEIEDAPLANITYSINFTEIVSNDGGGILQKGRDIHGSNNIFHWFFSDNVFQENIRGGLELTLPYTWQYDQEHHHTVFMRNNTFRNNRNFAVVLDGHYTRIEARWNWFMDNYCLRGLWQIRGMEKEILIEENSLERNKCEFVVEFFADSHTEKFGAVEAYFRKNRLYNNQFGTNDTLLMATPIVASYRPRSYTVAVRGIQKVNITDNLFTNNTLDYEFLAGIVSGSLASRVNVRQNWWGTTYTPDIRRRIFDFDDWNSYAVADFSPFLQVDKINGPVVRDIVNISYVDFERFGGRLYNSTVLYRREYPYIIRSDLTVMPGTTLHIQAGVELQFYPSVGILVLGALRAMGRWDMPIRMRPFIRDQPNPRWARSSYLNSFDSPLSKQVRMCTDRECGYRRQGFMELYNDTTRQWVPICDPYFTERNARVVCRESKYDTMNSHFVYGKRILDLDQNLLSKIVHWPEPRLCSGNEEHFEDCPLRFSGFYRPTYPCAFDSKFVFVYCGQRNLPEGTGYWGGIRFAMATFEPPSDRAYDAANTVLVDNSALEHVEIIGAGILHNDHSPALLAVSRTPSTFEFVNVSNCASDGISLVAPNAGMSFYGSHIWNNLGTGMRVSVLYGESRSSSVSSFVPLPSVTLPYNIFGMVDVCSSDKILDVQQRVLLYYKYDHNSADCVKIFYSYPRSRSLGFRLLQFNLLNTTALSPIPDSITLLDGDLYSGNSANSASLSTIPLILDVIHTESLNKQNFFRTKNPALTVRLHASGGYELLGFVAEVVTIPVVSTIDRNLHHNFTNCVMSGNVRGALSYENVGEIGPLVAVQHSQFRDNGVSLYGNFSTNNAAVKLDIQNTVRVFIQNNLFIHNQGALSIVADSETSAASMNAYVNNNLFFHNEKWEVIKVRGRKATPYQMIDIFRNSITQNYVPYKDILAFRRVVCNFTENYVVNNTGDHIMTVVAFDQTSTPNFQVIMYNSFWNNWALRWDQRTTIVLVGAGQRIEENVLLDPYNDFELMIRNLSTGDPLYSGQVALIDATNNWWGYNQSQAVSGRIWDGIDEKGLVQVVYEPFYLRNDTLLSGKCPPGWRAIRNTCFLYVGGTMEFDQAETYCESINGSIPYIEDSTVGDIVAFIARQQVNYDPRTYRIWVRTLGTSLRGCSSLLGLRTWETSCNTRLPFICETDPDVYLDPSDWMKYNITFAALGAVAATLLLVLLCVLFWLCKSRHRHLEKLERRNSIRSSIRSASSRSLQMGSTSSGLGDLAYRRKMLEIEPIAPKPVKLTEIKKANGSVDSIAKSGAGSRFGSQSSAFASSAEDNRSYDIVEAKNNQIDYSDYDEKYETEGGAPTLRPGTDDDYFDDTRATQTPSSFIDYGFDNRGFLETHFTSEETGSASTTSSTVDDPVDVKRQLELARESSGSYGSRSTPSTSSQEYPYRRQLLETEM